MKAYHKRSRRDYSSESSIEEKAPRNSRRWSYSGRNDTSDSGSDSDSDSERDYKRQHLSITFSDDDDTCRGIYDPIPMVITVKMMNRRVLRVSIDQGSSADILYWSAFSKLCLSESMLKPFDGALVGLAGKRVQVEGYIDLDTTFGEGEHRRTIKVRYMVVDSWSAYNVTIGRPTLNELGAIVSTPHMTMKYPARNGEVGVVKADLEMARKCYKMYPGGDI